MQYVSPSCVCHPRNKVVKEPALLQIDDIAEEPSASPIMDLDMDNNELEEGMYVVVTYQEVNFPGMITQLQPDGGAKVKVMHRCVGGWYWPSHDDEIVSFTHECNHLILWFQSYKRYTYTAFIMQKLISKFTDRIWIIHIII